MKNDQIQTGQFAGHRLTKHVKLLQKVVVLNEDRVLLLRRAKEAFYRADKWDLPGGNAEWPASKLDKSDLHRLDALRELEEETGIKLSPTKIGERPIYFGTYFEAERQLYTMIVGWQAKLPKDFDPTQVKISDEHTEFAWVALDHLDQYDFGFAGNEKGFIGRMLANIQ